MARKKIIAGNWKMNMTPSKAVELVNTLKPLVANDDVDVVFCVPAIDIIPVVEAAKGSNIQIGAENMYFEEKGAFTGEVSAEMLKDLGVDYVIMGHSERREYNNETDETVNLKAKKALEKGLIPIVCCGESLEQREAGITMDWIAIQIKKAFAGISADDTKKVVVAYEPIWAIGTGKTATSDQAEEMLAYIRSTVAEKYGAEAAEETSILYGGSCKASNAPELFSKPNIDGGLIGGASLKCADFKGIIDAWKK